MNSNQILILSVFLGYLLFNIVVSFVYSRRAEKSLHTTSEKKYFIGGRNMNGIVLAMTIMATYTSASSFISGPGAAGLTYGYAQDLGGWRGNYEKTDQRDIMSIVTTGDRI